MLLGVISSVHARRWSSESRELLEGSWLTWHWLSWREQGRTQEMDPFQASSGPI